MRFNLGQPATFTGTVIKDHPEEGGTTHIESGLPSWGGTEYNSGIVVGRRTLTDYRTRTYTESDDFGWSSYTMSDTRPVVGSGKTAWLVAFDLRCKPVLVWDHQIKELEEE